MKHILMFLGGLVLLMAIQLPAHAVTIDFEGLADLEPVTTQFPGLTFTNTTSITAGISLNEIDFPPRSGQNVVFDDGGPISIAFSPVVTEIGGFFTYTVPLILTAFDASGIPVALDTSNFSDNTAGGAGDPGSSPNEFLGVAFAGGIARVMIAGDPSGESFTLDDLTFTQVTTPIPEPSTLLLLVFGLLWVIGWRNLRELRNRTIPWLKQYRRQKA